MKLLCKFNPSISEEESILILECMEEDKIKIGELELGFKEAFKDPQRYGKIEWNHIWKHIKHKRENKVIDGGYIK